MKLTPCHENRSQAEQSAQRLTFIVRIWREPGATTDHDWRGTVEHIQTGERRAVADPPGALALMESWLGGKGES